MYEILSDAILGGVIFAVVYGLAYTITIAIRNAMNEVPTKTIHTVNINNGKNVDHE